MEFLRQKQKNENFQPKKPIKMKNQIKIFCLLMLFSLAANSLNAQANQSIESSVKAFLATLSADELKKISYAFEDSARLKWSNLPIGMVPRPGIAYGTLSDKSCIAFHRVLSAMLSSQGYLKITSIMRLDDILNVLYQESFDKGEIKAEMLKRMQDLKWAYGNYFISVWGNPQDKTPWGLDFGGHHIALNMTVTGNKVAMTPLFYGTDPAEIKTSKFAGLRVLSKEEDFGFMLINSLTEAQKAKAILPQKVPGDIITNPKSSQRITSYYGIAAAEFDETQKAILKMLIQEYIHNFEHNTAHRLYDEAMKTGIEKVYFAWIGSTENNKSHYYIINAPDFLIEYDNAGFANDGNHIHAITREKGGDFGEDLLKQHYLEVKH